MRQAQARKSDSGICDSAANIPSGQIADRPTDLDHRPKNPAISGRRVLDHHEHRSAPFAADTNTLEHTQENEQNRRRDSDLLVRGQKADQESPEPHDDDGHRQHGLPPDPIPIVPEDRST
jgi:hypothetical protein